MDINTKLRTLDAEVKLNLKDRKPMLVCDRLSKMYESGMDAKQKKKHDLAYIYFTRWIGCVEWLKTKGLDKGTIKKFFPSSKIKNVKTLHQEVINSLALELDVEKSRKYRLANPQLRTSKASSIDDDISLLLPDTPNEEPQPKENDEITCTELFKILNKNIKPSDKRLLVIDVRSKIDYDLTRISFPDKMINIPAEKIESNKAASYYACLLIEDAEAMDRFNRRSAMYTDIVVLLDWYSSLNTMKSNSPIAVLRRCLKEFDARTEYKRMAVLKGGFAEWINTYPTYVTNPSIKKPFVPKDTSSEKAGKVISDSLPSVSINENLNPMLTIPTTPNPYISDMQIFPTSDMQPMDTSSDTLDKVGYSPIPSIEDYTPSPILPRTRPLGVPVKQIPPSQIPTPMDINPQPALEFTYPDFARTYEVPVPTACVPPSSLVNGYYPDINSSTSSSIDRQLLRQNNITRDAKVSVEKLPERPPERPRIDRSKKPQTVGRKNSTSLLEVQQKMEKELADVRQTILMFSNRNPTDWTREQLDTLRIKEREMVAEIEKLRKSEEVKPSKLYPELPDVSTMSIGGKPRVPRPPKSDLSEEKENIPREAPRPKPADKPHMPPPPLKMEIVEDSDTEPEEEIRKEPLKPEKPTVSSGGLKRSHTSPDLLKVKKLKARQQEKKPVPEVNRSLKPKVVLENTNHNTYNAYYTSKDREQRLEPVYSSVKNHPGITGLKNLGNSCYMNSIIQCLSNTVYLAKYFNDNHYANDLNKNSDKGVQGYVAEEVAMVIKALWRGQYKSISPRDLKVVVGQYKLQFESYDQQDSHEFLMFLLDWMHNDLKQRSKISYDRQLTSAEKEWEKSMDGQSSIISKLFFGQLRSNIECLECRKNSTTYETFNSLTMSLPATNKCSLDDCVKKFVSGQKVSGWKCPHCKVPRESVKKFDIAKLPHIIVIHLNRFGETGGWLEKKNTAVDFPLSDFNLRPYLVQDSDYQLNNQQSSMYNLYAMSNHYGTMDGGHYTAYCKSSGQNKWYKYDDHTVTEVHQNQVKNQSNSAYLLFYTSASAEPYLNS